MLRIYYFIKPWVRNSHFALEIYITFRCIGFRDVPTVVLSYWIRWLLIDIVQGLGEARRIDEAFQMLESVEKGSAVGSPKLCAPLICGLLNALIESGLNFDTDKMKIYS